MNLPFKSFLVLSIAVLFSSSFAKPVSKTRKERKSLRAFIDYVETCADVDQALCEYEYYCGTRPQIMSKKCMKTCKMCVPGDPVIDLSSKCFVDLEKHQETLCIKTGWAMTCPHTCREYICDDRAQGCGAMVTSGACLSQHKYMTVNCKLSCGMCTPGDPLMDSSSECNPKQALCNDWEWKTICPHTCKRFVQPVQPQQAQPQPQQVGSVVQPQQPQQKVGQLPSQPRLLAQMPSQAQPQQAIQPRIQQTVLTQPQVAPQVGAQTGTPVQTSQLQPQVQQPTIPNTSQVNPAVQPSQVLPQIQQTTPQVNPVMQTSQLQPQTQQAATQVNPQVQPQIQQVQPQTQQATAQVNPQVQPQTQQVQPQMQQAAAPVNLVTPASQLQSQVQPTAPISQPLPVQQPVQQANQLQVNPGQVYQPVIQQPQPVTVGPMKKQNETKPPKATAVDGKTNNPKKPDEKETANKDAFRKKVKAIQGTKAKVKETKTKGEKIKNRDLKKKMNKKVKTPLEEESGSAVMPRKIKTNKTN